MRRLALVIVLCLAASPAFARKSGRSAKGPKEGRFCSKKMEGQTTTDVSGSMLTCKKVGKKFRWDK